MALFKDLTGKTFNNLYVIGPLRKPDKKGIFWLCRCVCGKEIHTSNSNLNKNRKGCGCIRNTRFKKLADIGERFGNAVVTDITKPNKCSSYAYHYKCDCGKKSKVYGKAILTKKSCGCMTPRARIRSGKAPVLHGEIRHYFWNMIKKCANKRKIDFNITTEYGWELFLKQNRKCALSGLDLVFYKRVDEITLKTASLDRIDSSKGYVEGNVQWVHKDVNWMKQTFSQDYFIEMCSNVSKYSDLKNYPSRDLWSCV